MPPVPSPAAPQLRLAELIALLSLGTDLGLGQPMEHVIRQCLIALRLADRLGLNEASRVVLYYSGLLAWVGCHTDAYEQAKWFGDDIAVKADGFLVDETGPAFLLSHLGAGKPLLERARAYASAGRPSRCARGLGEPLARCRRAEPASGLGRRGAPEPQGELRALGRQGCVRGEGR